MLKIIVELMLVLGVGVFIAFETKEKRVKKFAHSFVWLVGILIAFTIAYFAEMFGILSNLPNWNPLDYISIAAFCYIISSGVGFVCGKEIKAEDVC